MKNEEITGTPAWMAKNGHVVKYGSFHDCIVTTSDCKISNVGKIWTANKIEKKKRKIKEKQLKIQIETSTKIYTPFLNRIELTTWTICAFRVLNPRQWSWAKQVVKKVEKNIPAFGISPHVHERTEKTIGQSKQRHGK